MAFLSSTLLTLLLAFCLCCFQKPAALVKKPSVTGAQKQQEESDSSESDSDDESDEVSA